MHPETINEKTRCVLEKIAESEIAQNFYLAGGTALAIQLGHRQSMDLDWFSEKDFSNSDLKNKLASLGDFTVTSEEAGTVNGVLDGVKVSYIQYKYPLIRPIIDFEKIKMADKKDIAAMKLDAVSSRGSKKDFIDIYFLLEDFSLKDLLAFFNEKYSKIKYNKMHILKSLIFFDDAENEPLPLMVRVIEWEDIKKRIRTETIKQTE